MADQWEISDEMLEQGLAGVCCACVLAFMHDGLHNLHCGVHVSLFCRCLSATGWAFRLHASRIETACKKKAT